MIDGARAAAVRARMAVARSVQEQRRFFRRAFSLIVAMHSGKPDPTEAERFRKLMEERLASEWSRPSALQKWLKNVRGG